MLNFITSRSRAGAWLPRLAAALAGLSLLTAWPAPVPAAADEPLTGTFTAMGGIPINVSAWGLSQLAFDAALTQVEARVAELEAMMSDYQPASVISRLNRGEAVQPVPDEVLTVVADALSVSNATAGAFDITVKPLVVLWKRCAKEGRLPTAAERADALAVVGYQAVALNANATITFTKPGVMLDLGGIAKGYFSDQTVGLLRQAGATRCLVACAGDITTWQRPAAPDTKPFRVGVRDPEGEGLMAVLSLDGGSVTTSGNYERFYEIDGHRYCHIFDPHDGQPVEGMLAVTLVAPTGMEADAYATAVFVLGAERGRAFVEQRPDLEAIIVSRDAAGGKQVFVSSGLTGRIEFPTT